MKMVVLDGKAFNPGDLSWKPLEAFGNLTVYDRSAEPQIEGRAANAQAVFTNKTPLPAETLERLPKLRYIGILATGYNHVDVDAAQRLGIVVSNVPGYSTDSVAQLTFALLLDLSFRLDRHTEAVREGAWCRSEQFCFWNTPLVELHGLTFGAIGFGAIGRAVAVIARAFGMHVQTWTPRLSVGTEPFEGVRAVDLETLLRTSDVVSLHCPLTPDNHGFLNAERIAMLKPGAFVLNTARGPLIDEQALANALNEGRIAGAGLDVLSQEPPPEGNPLLSARNCLITPHLAWGTLAARARLMDRVAENLGAFLRGTPENVVW